MVWRSGYSSPEDKLSILEMGTVQAVICQQCQTTSAKSNFLPFALFSVVWQPGNIYPPALIFVGAINSHAPLCAIFANWIKRITSMLPHREGRIALHNKLIVCRSVHRVPANWKLGILREFNESGKVREMSGNFHKNRRWSVKYDFFSLQRQRNASAER